MKCHNRTDINAHPFDIYMYLSYSQVHIGSTYVLSVQYGFYSKNSILISFYCQYFWPELNNFFDPAIFSFNFGLSGAEFVSVRRTFCVAQLKGKDTVLQ